SALDGAAASGNRVAAVSANDRVLAVLQGGVLTATLNRPEKKNAIDAAMIDALLETLERADLDAEVRVVALRGAGADFCAGMDLTELLASADKSVEENRQAALRFGEVFLRMRQLPKPVIAVVQGRALAVTKQQFYQLDGLRFEDGIRLGADVNAVSRTTPDFRTALQAFLKK